MTIAEIHGKLRPYESMEDLLTSDVFGTFKYCSPQEGLVPFLEQAESFVDGSKSDLDFLKDVESAEYFFWPRSKSSHWREPDVIIILTLQNKENVAINIEAKYFSGKHNIEIDDTAEYDKESVDEAEGNKYHAGEQLVDQFLALKGKYYYNGNLRQGIEAALNSCNKFYLFYVTSHYLLPDQDVQETRDTARDNDIKYFYWLNWAQAWKICRSVKNENGTINIILNDLRQLLERKRLIELALWKGIEYIFLTSETHYFWMEQKVFWQINTPQFEYNHVGCFFWNRCV